MNMYGQKSLGFEVKPKVTKLTNVGKAVFSDDPDQLEKVIHTGCHVNSTEKLIFENSEQIMSPLSLACRINKANRAKVIHLLIDAGANPDRCMFDLNAEIEEEGAFMLWGTEDIETPLVYTVNKQNAFTVEALLHAGVDPLHLYTNKTLLNNKTKYLIDHVSWVSENCFLSLFRAGGILSEEKIKDSKRLCSLLVTLCNSLQKFPNACLYLFETQQDWTKSVLFYMSYRNYTRSRCETKDREKHQWHIEEIERRNGFSTSMTPPYGLHIPHNDAWPGLSPMDDITEFDVTMAQVYEVFFDMFYPHRPMPLKKLCRGLIRQHCGRIKLVEKIQSLTKHLSVHLTQYLLYNIDLGPF